MAKFTDKLGRGWELDLTVADLKAVRLATGVEFTAGGGASLYDQIAVLAGDFDKMGRAVWAMVADQAAAQGVDYESFEKGLNRATVKASALALIDAFLDFYHGPAADPMKEAVRAAVETTEQAELAKSRAALGTTGPSPSSAPPGSTPASPGSTRAA